MLDEIKEFFDRFVNDFSLLDGSVVAQRYLSPYTAVSRDGDLWLCHDYSEVVEYFKSLVDKHASEGVVKCQYADPACEQVGQSSFFASVTWTMMREDGSAVSTWRESYNLVKTASGLKIFTSIDH